MQEEEEEKPPVNTGALSLTTFYCRHTANHRGITSKRQPHHVQVSLRGKYCITSAYLHVHWFNIEPHGALPGESTPKIILIIITE